VVLQECARPPAEDAAPAWFGENPRLGVAVLARPPFRVTAEPGRAGSRSMFAARVDGPISFTVLAVWARAEPSYSAALRQGLACYGDLLSAGPTVILGDLNSSVAWDAQRGRTDHLAFETTLREQFGLVSAYHAATGEAPGQESRPTHYWRWKESAPFHLDYCYLPAAWLPGLQTVTVGSYREWADVSDHRPLVVDVHPPATIARAAAEPRRR
jgi:endonuclease/exonuclease/phosphatase family metal-dependent hydrolase